MDAEREDITSTSESNYSRKDMLIMGFSCVIVSAWVSFWMGRSYELDQRIEETKKEIREQRIESAYESIMCREGY